MCLKTFFESFECFDKFDDDNDRNDCDDNNMWFLLIFFYFLLLIFYALTMILMLKIGSALNGSSVRQSWPAGGRGLSGSIGIDKFDYFLAIDIERFLVFLCL